MEAKANVGWERGSPKRWSPLHFLHTPYTVLMFR
jgi:hypothetical protein